MAHIGKLPTFKRVVTTHNDEGQAVVHKSVHDDPAIDTSIEQGRATFCLAYTTTEFPVDLNYDKDIKRYQDFLHDPPGIVQSGGTVLRIVDIAPGSLSPMHRTVSLDYGVVMIGEIELVLESGETRLLGAGDICIQRGTMHAWRNTSLTEWARMLYVLQPCQPVQVGDKTLEEDYGNMLGVKSSS